MACVHSLWLPMVYSRKSGLFFLIRIIISQPLPIVELQRHVYMFFNCYSSTLPSYKKSALVSDCYYNKLL